MVLKASDALNLGNAPHALAGPFCYLTSIPSASVILNASQPQAPYASTGSLQGWECVLPPSSAWKRGPRGRGGGGDGSVDELEGVPHPRGHAILQDCLIQLLVPPVSV